MTPKDSGQKQSGSPSNATTCQDRQNSPNIPTPHAQTPTHNHAHTHYRFIASVSPSASGSMLISTRSSSWIFSFSR